MTSKNNTGQRRNSFAFWIYFVVAFVLVAWIGWRTQDTANEQERQGRITTAFAVQTQDCLEQLTTILNKRSRLNDINNNLSIESRLEVLNIIHDILEPPPELKGVPQSDQRYQTWIGLVMQKHYAIMAEQSKRQNDVLEDLKQNPIPEPLCAHEIPR